MFCCAQLNGKFVSCYLNFSPEIHGDMSEGSVWLYVLCRDVCALINIIFFVEVTIFRIETLSIICG